MAKKRNPLAAALRGALGSRAAAPAKLLLVGAALCSLMATVPAMAAGPAAGRLAEVDKRPAPSKLPLFAKDPATWKIVAGGAAGMLSYREQTGEFSFAAARLEPQTGYALVRYGEASGKADGKADLLAEGKSDREGNLQLAGVWRQWTKKIWLVLRADLTRSGNQVTATAWQPQRYLFEEKELGIPCDCE